MSVKTEYSHTARVYSQYICVMVERESPAVIKVNIDGKCFNWSLEFAQAVGDALTKVTG